MLIFCIWTSQCWERSVYLSAGNCCIVITVNVSVWVWSWNSQELVWLKVFTSVHGTWCVLSELSSGWHLCHSIDAATDLLPDSNWHFCYWHDRYIVHWRSSFAIIRHRLLIIINNWLQGNGFQNLRIVSLPWLAGVFFKFV